MKKSAVVLIASITINILFYLFDRYGVEEFGGLSHIGLLGLILFIPYLFDNVPKNCHLYNVFHSVIAFTPMVVVKFDIITLIVILIYSLFLNFTICNKLKRRYLEAED